MTDDTNYSVHLDAQVGDTWSRTVNSITSNYALVADNVQKTVPAGTFNCKIITYNQTGAFNTDTIYWNNSVGYVHYSGFGALFVKV